MCACQFPSTCRSRVISLTHQHPRSKQLFSYRRRFEAVCRYYGTERGRCVEIASVVGCALFCTKDQPAYDFMTENCNSHKFPTVFCACNHAQQLLTRAYLWQFRGVRVTSEEPELHKQASLQVSVVPCVSERCRLGCAISPAMSFDCPQTMKKFPRNPTLTNDWQGQAVRSR